MPLKILHVFSSDFFAGSVAYALGLAEKQAMEEHDVYMISDSDVFLHINNYYQLPVSNRSMKTRLSNIKFIKKFICKHNINIIHGHSRAASWISYYAVKGTDTALVSTIHGKQVKHSKIKKLDVFGERIIAICPNLVSHLKDELKFDKQKIRWIPNGLNFESLKQYKNTVSDKNFFTISIIGRLNGPKGVLISNLISKVLVKLLDDFQQLKVQIIGGEWNSLPENGKNDFNILVKKHGVRISYLGFIKDIYPIIAASDLVIGAGRVAIETLALNIPLFAIGEACSLGVITNDNIQNAINSNFGDILISNRAVNVENEDILAQITNLIINKEHIKLNYDLEVYNIDFVYKRINQEYNAAIIQKKHPSNIPILMYHKVPEKPINTEHKTYITKQEFEFHLKFFKNRGMQSITFNEYDMYSRGEKPINTFPKKPFILTFDDGYENNHYNMLPLTKAYGFKGVIFLLGDFACTSNTWDKNENPEDNKLMNTSQKNDFLEAGWEIGAHTNSHPNLLNLSNSEALNEISSSKKSLEEAFNTKVISFAYPFGNYNSEIKSLVEKSGFKYGVATDTGGLTIEEDRMAIFRINMFPNESPFQLFKKTSSWYRKYYFWKRKK